MGLHFHFLVRISHVRKSLGAKVQSRAEDKPDSQPRGMGYLLDGISVGEKMGGFPLEFS